MNESFCRSLERENENLWVKVLNHLFVEEIGNLKLSVKKFKTFIEQDYQYLLGLIKCLGLFLAKSESKANIVKFRDFVEVNFKELRSFNNGTGSVRILFEGPLHDDKDSGRFVVTKFSQNRCSSPQRYFSSEKC